MARIRTIKPEFFQSESVSRLSRDARLLFLGLLTIADDEGRARAAPKLIAGELFPYDDDRDVEAWLDEIEAAGMIRRYAVEGSRYLVITGWTKHQKIDHPTRSKLPPFDASAAPLASSRENVASPRETLAPDLGPRIKDLGSEEPSFATSGDKSPSVAPEAAEPLPDRSGLLPELRAAAGVSPPQALPIRDALWRDGVPIVRSLIGLSDAQARAFLGRLLRETHDDCARLYAALREAEELRPLDPKAWLAGACREGPPRSRERPSKFGFFDAIVAADGGKIVPFAADLEAARRRA